MFWIVAVGIAILAALIFKPAVRQQSPPKFVQLASRVDAAETAPKGMQPDLAFAANGYMQVAVSRRFAPHIDLHKLERGFAEELLSEGCTRDQALSARWGGAYAISDELRTFDDALAVFKETAAEYGRVKFKTTEEAKQAYHAAALAVITMANLSDPQEYPRFLQHIGA